MLPSSLAEPEAAPEPGRAWGSFTFLCPPRHNRGGPSTSHLALPFPLPPRSFCSEHRPQQAVQAAPEQGTTCIICMDPVGDSTSYHTMVCPACNHAWFHRRCIQVGALPSPCGHGSCSAAPGPAHRSLPVFLLQGHAMCAGIVCFQCPICRDRVLFSVEMSNMGIRIPRRLVSLYPALETRGHKRCAQPGTGQFHPFSCREPTWEDNDAFASQRERHQRCDASECLYPRGREQAEVHG